MQMSPRGFWSTLENLIGREKQRQTGGNGYGDVGKWLLALPSLRKEAMGKLVSLKV